MMKRLGWSITPLLALALVSAAPAAGAPAKTPSVVGAAWHQDNTPIKGANLRLRNVVTGKVFAIARANDLGRFVFENVEPGTYVVELVNDAGHVQTVSQTFTVARDETVATFVRLGAHTPWTAAFFSNTAGAIVATAATEGITALAPLGRCASPPCS